MVATKYWPLAELAWLFGFAESTIREWAKKGEFGPDRDFLRVGNDIRIPSSGVLFFINSHLNQKNEAQRLADQVRGRTLGEARRKAQQVSAGSADV